MTISGKTALVGLIGWPVEHSFSPQMHNAAAADLGLDLVYVPLPVRPQAVEAAVKGLGALGFLGANVTIPHKQAVIPFLDRVTEAAEAIGAVNTIRVARGQKDEEAISNLQSPISNLQSLTGHNTDWRGFLLDLSQKQVTVAGRQCVVLGAGGAARAVAYALAQEGGRVTVSARRPEQAEALIAALAPYLPSGSLTFQPWERRAEVEHRALIVNATPVGMHPREAESPWPEGAPFPGAAFVYDLIYNPAETRLLAEARAAGCHTANGLGMLLYQGALAFELWTGIRPEIRSMANALEPK